MKIKINAVLMGEEIVQGYIIPQLEANNIKFDANCLKIYVVNSKGADVEVGADKIKFVFDKE